MVSQVPKGFNRNNYETPDWFFNSLNREFRFSFDLCATPKTAKCKKFFTPKDNALEQDWFLLKGWLWINPPYSPLKPWMEKIQEEAQAGAKIVALVPPVVCAKYFGKFFPSEVRFIIGRINFLADGVEIVGNRQDSCVMVFGHQASGKAQVTWVNRDEILKGKKNGNV